MSSKYPVPPTPNTFCGRFFAVVLLIPNSPSVFLPIAHTLPFASNAKLYHPPADIWIILLNTPVPVVSCTCLILVYAVVFPTPIPPWQLCPTDQSVPSSFTINDSHCPIEISFTAVTGAVPLYSNIYTGYNLSVLVPSPNKDCVFAPHAITSLVSNKAIH